MRATWSAVAWKLLADDSCCDGGAGYIGSHVSGKRWRGASCGSGRNSSVERADKIEDEAGEVRHRSRRMAEIDRAVDVALHVISRTRPSIRSST
jgi:hypothetical protein